MSFGNLLRRAVIPNQSLIIVYEKVLDINSGIYVKGVKAKSTNQ